MQDKAVHDYARLGELLQLRNQPKAAVVEYEKAYAKAGLRYTTLVNRLARAYVETDRGDEAIKLLDADLAQHPEDSDAHLLAGRVRLKREQWDLARGHFEAVRLQNPFNPEIHLALGALYAAQKDTQGAEREHHFMELAQAPRPTRNYEAPKVPASEATLCITSLPWGQVQIDDGPSIPTPAWELPVKAGPHTLTFVRPDGSKAVQKVKVETGNNRTVVLR
jgi:tetratricopeptide (TPR) repeat protein